MDCITLEVLPDDYEVALWVDGQRWVSSDKPCWPGKRVWRLRKGTTERVMWSFKGFQGECYHQRNQ